MFSAIDGIVLKPGKVLMYVFVDSFWRLTLHKTWQNTKDGRVCSYN